ncbi:MAG TPA: polyprenyl diphosphate synthase [Candidatus Saccharimonadales bacterium]|nr:polyprenyl diphosphate synthase [Candidatus Saccharimonadales bacterium]
MPDIEAGTPEILKVPKHLGIIPDGNRRWAKRRGLPVIEGHRQGYRNVRSIARHAMDMGVEYVSVFGFSTENWRRPPEEVTALMGLLEWIAKRETKSLDKEGIRVRFSGKEEGLQPSIVKALRSAEDRTAQNERGDLVMCINYSGQEEIVDALKSIMSDGVDPEEVNKSTIESHMYLPDLPDMDLLVRTSGEQRISDFMPWKAAHAEFASSPRLWPDFTTEDLVGCIAEYGQRDRRLGA